MCIFGASPPKPPPPPAPAATDPDADQQNARDAQQRRARAAQGYSSTIVTSASGDTSTAGGTGKTLLGQ